jgi:hypothetical protein
MTFEHTNPYCVIDTKRIGLFPWSDDPMFVVTVRRGGFTSSKVARSEGEGVTRALADIEHAHRTGLRNDH